MLYKPSNYAGIAVLRLPKQPNHQDLLEAIATLIKALKSNDLTGKLWIVQRGTIRIYSKTQAYGVSKPTPPQPPPIK